MWPPARRRRHRWRTDRALLARLDETDRDPPERRAFLLEHGPGAVVAIGDPDVARHVAVLVPGTGVSVDDVVGQVNRATNVHLAVAPLLDDPRELCVVAWIGYRPPAHHLAALLRRYALVGAPRLRRFVAGLRAGRDPAPHVTVLGHSYGSVVVGVAAGGPAAGDTGGLAAGDTGGLAADDIVVTGSPGMRVRHARELGARVWVGAFRRDWVTWRPVHGTPPHRPEFGARRFHAQAPGGAGFWEIHQAYWHSEGSDDERAAMRNQAYVIVGRHDAVT